MQVISNFGFRANSSRQPMRKLKILVVVMGVMLVAGTATLVVAIAARLSHPRPVATPTGAAAPIGLPAGARIESIGVGGDRLVVAVLLPDGDRQLLVLDLANGRQLMLIPLSSGP